MLEADRVENICSKKRLLFAPFYAILRKEQMFCARKGDVLWKRQNNSGGR